MLELIRDLTLFVLIIGGGALPVAARLSGYAPLERTCVGIGVSLILLYLTTFALYLCGLAWVWLWLLPLAAWGWNWRHRAALRLWATDPAVRATAAGWLLLSAWCLGWQALVFSYSGAGWAGDWHEHYDRARFFVQHWPLDYRFIGFNPLPARPPLANLANAGLLGLAGTAFGQFQVFATLFSTLLFFPLAALTQRRGANLRAIRLLTLVLMLNPLLVQNATFPWTKLPAALFVLLGVVLLLRSLDRATGHGWAAIMLAAGLLVHYSVAPWIIALLAAWAWCGRRAWASPGYWRETWIGAGLAAGLLATWLGWAAYAYGPTQLVQATSTVGQAATASWGGRVVIALGNIGHTLVFDWDAPLFRTLLQQADQWARLRDLWFCIYQHNLPVACGLGGAGVLAWLLANARTRPAAPFWWITAALVIVLGVAAVTVPAELGVTHICLQPLVLVALAWAVLEWQRVPRWLRIFWIGGLVLDAVLGIALHFGVQSLYLQTWANPGLDVTALIGRSASTMMLNFRGKLYLHEPFLFDRFAGNHGLLVIMLGCLLALAVQRCRQPAAAHDTP